MKVISRNQLVVPARADVKALASSDDFRVGVKASDDSVEMLIHGAIGDSWQGLDSGSVRQFLSDNRGKTINVDINSGGGLAYDGVAIYNALAAHDAAVNIDITGLAASAASIIAMAGTRVRIAENAQFMLHRAWAIAIGNKTVMMDAGKWLDKLDDQLAATYAARTGRKAETMLKMMDGETDGTWFTGKEAVDEGFADEVIPLKKKSKDSTASASVEQFKAEAQNRARAALARLRAVELDGEAV